jgi:hypothetical protein
LISAIVDMFLREDQANATFFGPFNRCLGGYQPLEESADESKIEKADTLESMQTAPSVQECEKHGEQNIPLDQNVLNKV